MKITEFKNCKSKRGKQLDLTWDELVEKLSEPIITSETIEEYKKMDASEKSKIKDVGGFIGGELIDNCRKNSCLLNRSLITLDVDYADDSFFNKLEDLNFNYIAYSTHSHYTGHERYRLILPLDRPVGAEEYEAISRKIAEKIGIDLFDDSTYQPARLMFYPSISKDAYLYCDYESGSNNVWTDFILSEYTDWKDTLSWPTSSRVQKKIRTTLKEVEDPESKDCAIGTFCRAYNIHEAIDAFLSDVYEPTLIQDRYSYVPGSTYGGAITYDDKFLYSHHGTDPCSEQLVNSFDLVRIHKFGNLDKDTKEVGTNLPSYKKMVEFMRNDDRFKAQFNKDTEIRNTKLVEAFKNFDDIYNLESTEIGLYDFTENGKVKSTVKNIVTFLKRNLIGHVWYDSFSNRAMTDGTLPWMGNRGESEWTDSDDAGIRYQIENDIGLFSKPKCEDALKIYFSNASVDPVKNYLDSLKWDGIKRVDNLLIDYLGAANTDYNKFIIRKVLTAAIARVYKPGVKFDNMMVLVGSQGIGKSTFIRFLGGKWYSDSFTTVQGKEAYEQLQGVWIGEMSELAATKKAEIDSIKHFLSKQEDRFRQAYGRRTMNYKRRGILIGTTNDELFLKDWSGNRRFWPVECGIQKVKKDIFTQLELERDQIFAEAKELFLAGENLHLDKLQNEDAIEIQKKHTESSSKKGIIEEFLNKQIPVNWDDWTISDRQLFIENPKAFDTDGWEFKKRDSICPVAVWCECFGHKKGSMKNSDSREINAILTDIEGWKRVSSKRYPTYGVQRSFERC